MPINELLPFATGVGAGVMDQASWSGLPARLTGFVAGIAEPTQVNKAWRQGLFTSSMIGQFTMHNSGFDTLDNGDVDTYEAHFLLAIQNIAFKNAPLWLIAGGTADALTATVPAAFTTLNSLHGVIINLVTLSGYNSIVAPTLVLTPSGGSSFASKNLVRRNNTSLAVGEVGGSSVVQMAFDQNIQAFRLLNRHGGNSIIDPGTGALERNHPPLQVTGANRAYVASDRGRLILRSNGGAAMADTLPSAGSVMLAGWKTSIKNTNYTGAYGELTITPSGGALLDGSSLAKTLYPGASCEIVSDGTNYFTITETVFPRIISGSSNGNLTTGMIWRGSGGRGMMLCWGSVSVAPSSNNGILLPASYESSSFAITFGQGGVSGAGFSPYFLNQTAASFDLYNASASVGGVVHWNTWGGVI